MPMPTLSLPVPTVPPHWATPWPLGSGLLGAMAAMAGVQMQPSLLPASPLWMAAALCLLGALLGALRAHRLAPPWRGVVVLALALSLGLSLGLAWATWRAHERMAHTLDPAWEGRDVQITARVTGLPTALEGFGGASGWRLSVRVITALDPDTGQPLALPGAASLTWFEGKGRERAPRAGESWRFTVRLKQVQLTQNPGLPDTELWLLERGVRMQGSVRSGQHLAPAPWWDVNARREALRDAIHAQVNDPRQRAVLAGLVIGDQAALPAADWTLLRDAGVVHLFSISGLHITVFAWATGWLVRRIWRHSPRLTAAWATPAAARWLGLLAALAYAVLSGWGVPAQRTVGLLAVLALLGSSGRRWPWPLALLLAGAVVGAADPWALVQPGFWLSFVAVGVLMNSGGTPTHAAPEGPRWRSAVHELLRTQAVVTVGLLPLTLLFFGQVSVVGVVANLVAVPLVTLALVPLALAGVVLPLAWGLAGWLVTGLWAVLQPLAALPWAVLALPQAPSALMALALVGTALALQRWPRWWRMAGLLCWLPMLLYQPPRPAPGSFRLLVLDVGQGSATWVQTAAHNLLLDAGPRWGAVGQDAGSRTVLPVLKAQGVRRLDVLAISHADSDHSGGAASVALGLPVGAVVGSLPAGHPLAARAQPCAAGQSWQWDGVTLRWLHPLPDSDGSKTNAIACVLQVTDAAGRTALLTADIEAPQEAELLARSAPGALHADLLLVPHHGSNTSSTAAFIAAVQPSLALAQSGYRNRHGHPALPVVQRYHAAGVRLLTSAGCGAFEWWSGSGAPSSAGCWRERRVRYWHNRGVVGGEGEVGPERPVGEF